MRRFETLPSLSVLVLGLALLPGDLAGQNPSSAERPATTGGFRIAGKVVNALVGSPLARARVLIVDIKNQQKTESTVTSEDGSFEFLGLGAGKYALNGAKRGFITSAYEQHERFSTAIVTGSGLDTEHLVLRLAPDALLMGTVLDESGEPVRGATVSLYRKDRQAGEERIHKVRTARTDDQGAYEFSRLDGGTYFLSAIATPWYAVHHVTSRAEERGNGPEADRSLDVAYPESYYKDATEPEGASPIPIRGGDRLEADIHLNPVPALHLIVRMPSQDVSAPTLQRSAFEGTDSISTGWDYVSPGVYEIDGIAPGTYTIRMPGAGSGSSTFDLDIDLKEDGQEIDASKGEPAARLKALVRLVGGETLPAEVTAGLRGSTGGIVAWRRVNSQGEVEFGDLAPGRYEVLVESPQRAYSLVRISSGDAVTVGDMINVAAGRSLDVSLLVAGSTTNVEGVAERNGHPVAGVMVVLVPKDPESNRTLFRRDQSDLDGSFSLRNVIPGAYTIVAIDDGWDLEWALPSVIRAYSQHAKTIRVGESQGSIQLPDAVEVQAR